MYSVRIGDTLNNHPIRWFETYQEASAFCDRLFAETGEMAWVRRES